MIDSDLYKSVLRAQHYDPTTSTVTDGSGISDTTTDHLKIVGSHLLLSKRSSNPSFISSSTATNIPQLHHHHHTALTATASLFSAVAIAAQGNMAPVCRSPDPSANSSATATLLSQANLELSSALGVTNIHRRLDRSHSEPVWQQQQPQQDGRQGSNSSRYKTELCRPFEENGFCKYGDKCQFAHGGLELRTLNRHPKYKTELCRTFHTSGFCPYGPRCHFIHNAEESRVLSPVMGPAPPVSGPLAAHLAGQLAACPPLVSSSAGVGLPNTHSPLTISPSMGGLPTIFDKNSPPTSSQGSPPPVHGSFFDEINFRLMQNHLIGSISDTLNALSINDNKINSQLVGNNMSNSNKNNGLLNTHFNSSQLFNGISSNQCSSPTNSSSSSSISGNSYNSPNNSYNELLWDSLVGNTNSSNNNNNNSHQLLTMDTPPASPPDMSACPPSDDPNNPLNSSLRLPIFQSINPMQ